MAAKPQRPDGTFNHLKAVSMPQHETLPLFNLAGSAAQWFGNVCSYALLASDCGTWIILAVLQFNFLQ